VRKKRTEVLGSFKKPKKNKDVNAIEGLALESEGLGYSGGGGTEGHKNVTGLLTARREEKAKMSEKKKRKVEHCPSTMKGKNTESGKGEKEGAGLKTYSGATGETEGQKVAARA